MNWQERFKLMKKGMSWTNKDLAEITGNTPESVKTVTRTNGNIPRWLRLAVVIYEELSPNDMTFFLEYYGGRLKIDKGLKAKFIDSKTIEVTGYKIPPGYFIFGWDDTLESYAAGVSVSKTSIKIRFEGEIPRFISGRLTVKKYQK